MPKPQALVIAVLLCACQETPAPQTGKPTTTTPTQTAQTAQTAQTTQLRDAAPAVVKRTRDAASIDALAQPADLMQGPVSRWTITRSSVDRITQDTKATARTLRKALPGLSVAKSSRSVEGESYQVFEVYARKPKKVLLFHIVPGDAGAVQRVHVSSKKLQSKEGISVGSSGKELWTTVGDLDCGEGDEDDSIYALCTTDALPELTFAFKAPEKGEPMYKRTDRQVRAHLADKPVVEIRWIPPEGGQAAAENTTDDDRRKWRRCLRDADCIVIPSYCGGWASVNQAAADKARVFYDKVGSMKDCRRGTAAKPTPKCQTKLCEPANVWNRP